jgi:GDP-L-fucose synthase
MRYQSITKNVIVTGSNGMLGSALKRMVNKKIENDLEFGKKFKFDWLTRDKLNLNDRKAVYNYIANYKIDDLIVVNLAADVGGLFKNRKSNLYIFENNMDINYNLLKCCAELGVEKVINILSTCIFPDKTSYPLLEENINNGPPHNSNPGYSYSKRFAQIYSTLINNLNDHYKYVNLIPTNLYGKNDNYKIEDAHVIPAIIHKAYLKSVDKESNVLELPGDGNAERMFLYDEDLANVIIDFISIDSFYQCSGDYIVSGDIENSMLISELAKKIGLNVSNITNSNIAIKFESNVEDNGQNKKPCSNKKIKDLYSEVGIEYPPNDSKFNNNLEEVVGWFIRNYNYYLRK